MSITRFEQQNQVYLRRQTEAQERIAAALENVAASLEKVANPLRVVAADDTPQEGKDT